MGWTWLWNLLMTLKDKVRLAGGASLIFSMSTRTHTLLETFCTQWNICNAANMQWIPALAHLRHSKPSKTSGWSFFSRQEAAGKTVSIWPGLKLYVVVEFVLILHCALLDYYQHLTLFPFLSWRSSGIWWPNGTTPVNFLMHNLLHLRVKVRALLRVSWFYKTHINTSGK